MDVAVGGTGVGVGVGVGSLGVAVGGTGVLVGGMGVVAVAVGGTGVGVACTGSDVGVACAGATVRAQAVAARMIPSITSTGHSLFPLIAKPPFVIPFLMRLGIVYHVSPRLATQKSHHAVHAGGFSTP